MAWLYKDADQELCTGPGSYKAPSEFESAYGFANDETYVSTSASGRARTAVPKTKGRGEYYSL
jgi:hypothetical protein